jgi:putative endonuclease
VETAPAPVNEVVHNLAAGGPGGPSGGYGPAMAATRPSTDERLELGRLGEALAATLLEAAGLRVLARNWRCREGEIDLVAAGPGLLVFCEVKTRRGSGFGSPAAAVTQAKQARLRRLAATYLATMPTPPCRVRFDVVAVTWPRERTFYTVHQQRTPVRWRVACPLRPNRPRRRIQPPTSGNRLEP